MCVCCGERRGYIYAGPVYSERELSDSLCPWCIADGSAHSRFGAEFTDAAGAKNISGIRTAIKHGLPPIILVLRRYWLPQSRRRPRAPSGRGPSPVTKNSSDPRNTPFAFPPCPICVCKGFDRLPPSRTYLQESFGGHIGGGFASVIEE